MKLTTLQALFTDQLKDLYDAENQILRALPKMAKTAISPELRQALTSELEQSQAHVHRLDKIFLRLGVMPKGSSARAMEILVAEGKDLAGDDAQATVFDAALIAAAQRMEHYGIAGLGSARTAARRLGYDNIAEGLEEILNDKHALDKKLTELAEAIVGAVTIAARG